MGSRWSIRVANGTPEDNYNYCRKGEMPGEVYQMLKEQGKDPTDAGSYGVAANFFERGERPDFKSKFKGWLYSLDILNELCEEARISASLPHILEHIKEMEYLHKEIRRDLSTLIDFMEDDYVGGFAEVADAESDTTDEETEMCDSQSYAETWENLGVKRRNINK